MALLPVTRKEVVVGEPLPWTLYDVGGHAVVPEGFAIGSAEQLEQLLEAGIYRHAEVRSPAGRQESSDTDAIVLSLEQLRLRPGDFLQLQSAAGRSGERYPVRVVGYMSPISLLVSAPTVQGKLVFVREGQSFLLRGFVGKDAVACRTRVLRTSLAPFPYLHLEYPQEVQAMRIRQSARVPVDLMTSIAAPLGSFSGRIVDLSVGGARVESTRPFGDKGQEVKLSFRVNAGGVQTYMHLRGRVRIARARDEAADGCASTGVEFIEVGEQERLYLMNLVYQQLLDPSID